MLPIAVLRKKCGWDGGRIALAVAAAGDMTGRGFALNPVWPAMHDVIATTRREDGRTFVTTGDEWELRYDYSRAGRVGA